MKKTTGFYQGRVAPFIWGFITALILLIVAVVVSYFYKSGPLDLVTEDRLNPVSQDVSTKQKEIIKKVIVRDPLPEKHVNYKRIDTARLWSGVESNTQIEFKQGKEASFERMQPGSYTFDFNVKLNSPKPVSDLKGLSNVNPLIVNIVPDLSDLLVASKVSGFYYKLYEIKAKRVQQYLTRLNAIPDKHNYYDCETILEMKHPKSGRKVLLIQSDMDVVSDGSDGDRMPEYDKYIAESTNYQPFTSYGWRKKTSTPNPLLKRWENKLSDEKKNIANTTRSSQKAAIEQNISKLKREIVDMKARSFLIARADPFIVIPSWMRSYKEQNHYAPSVGDYVAVIHKGGVYPAIIGDTGPTWKIGEASLRLAKTLNPKATSYSRPVSDLKVSYLIFPGTASKPDAPNLKEWGMKIKGFLNEIGGLGEGYSLHNWESYFQ